jgi:hypothetical protein
MSWIQSYSGREVHPLDLRPEQVTFEDIPHALAQKVRFNGHLREMGYSVAQHCVLGAEQIVPASDRYLPTEEDARKLRLAFLLHECGEVFCPDVPAPIKPHLRVQYNPGSGDSGRMLKTWSELEDEHTRVILQALGLSELLPLIDSKEVHEMDVRMLMTEKRDLMGPGPGLRKWSTANVEPLPIKIDRCWGPEEAKAAFTRMYRLLTGRS